MSTKEDTSETNWLESEAFDDWVTTSHDRVYFRDGGVFALPSVESENLLKAGAAVAESVPEEWSVVVTAGPYRGYDVHYEVHDDKRLIYLDFYSVRPGYHHLADVIEDIQEALNQLSTS